jgi:hypothetical protein
MTIQRNRAPAHSTNTSNLADILERVLDKGIVIAGDIKVKLVDVELLTIQVRLLVASVDKAREMGMDWWVRNPDFVSNGPDEPRALRARIAELEGALARAPSAVPVSALGASTREDGARPGEADVLGVPVGVVFG